MILNIVLFLLIIVLTVAVALWFTIDYKRAKAGKNLFYRNAKATPAPTAIHKRKIKEAADNGGN